MKPIHKFVKKNEIFCEILKRLLQDCEDEEGVARHALTHKVPAHLLILKCDPVQIPKLYDTQMKMKCLSFEATVDKRFICLIAHNKLVAEKCVPRLWKEVQHRGAAWLSREGVSSMSASQVLYNFHRTFHICLHFPQNISYLFTINICVTKFSFFQCLICVIYLLLRCDYCGQGFILAARLKHHRRGCHVRSITSCKSK